MKNFSFMLAMMVSTKFKCCRGHQSFTMGKTCFKLMITCTLKLPVHFIFFSFQFSFSSSLSSFLFSRSLSLSVFLLLFFSFSFSHFRGLSFLLIFLLFVLIALVPYFFVLTRNPVCVRACGYGGECASLTCVLTTIVHFVSLERELSSQCFVQYISSHPVFCVVLLCTP